MKKTLLLIVLPFAFLSALSAQVTQEQADEIVLERMSRETFSYIIYAKEGVQTKMTVTTIAGEELELDYPCWVYACTPAGAGIGPLIGLPPGGLYLIVNASNGNLMEIKGRFLGNFTEWRIVKTSNCNMPLTSALWASVDNLPPGNYEPGKVYVINTVDELKQHPYFFQNGVGIPDLTTKSIIVNYFAGCIFCDVKSSFCAENGYNRNIVFYTIPHIMCFRAANYITYMFVDKIPANSTVTLNASVTDCTNEPMTTGNVLMLKVDYLTNKFKGGYEFAFDNVPNSFNVRREYMPPGDFGYVKFYYHETGDMLFHGTIHWMGEGKIHYPENLLPASAFEVVNTEDFIIPTYGFENIMGEPQPKDIDYESVWAGVQNLVKVREYLEANPVQKVKIFLYTPCVGVGDPEHWDWIIFLKKGDEPGNEIRHIKTELGGCNNRAGLRNESEDLQEDKKDEVIVNTSSDSVRVFVGLNYICKTAPFETKCDIENNTIRMYITDTCMDLPDCEYLRCDCYYTFDFQFERKGETNYKYIVELISPWSGNRILAEGTIEEKNTPFSAAQMTNSVNQFSMEFFATAHDALKSDANIVLSPLSLNMALAMVWNGANGDTRQGIQQAMGMQNYAEKDVNNYFFHQENTTGTTLFMGKIGKP